MSQTLAAPEIAPEQFRAAKNLLLARNLRHHLRHVSFDVVVLPVAIQAALFIADYAYVSLVPSAPVGFTGRILAEAGAGVALSFIGTEWMGRRKVTPLFAAARTAFSRDTTQQGKVVQPIRDAQRLALGLGRFNSIYTGVAALALQSGWQALHGGIGGLHPDPTAIKTVYGGLVALAAAVMVVANSCQRSSFDNAANWIAVYAGSPDAPREARDEVAEYEAVLDNVRARQKVRRNTDAPKR